MRFLFLLAAPCALIPAEEAVAVTLPEGSPWWAQLLVTLLALVVVPFVTNYLKKAADAKRAELENIQADSKDRVLTSLKLYAFERAESYVERDFLVLAKMITTGEIKDSSAVKDYLKSLGIRLRDDLIVYAREQLGTDLLKEYGDKVVNEIIEYVANKVSPFPGKETAITLLNGGAQALLKHGVKAADKYLSTDE